jgi:hypothetical protein
MVYRKSASIYVKKSAKPGLQKIRQFSALEEIRELDTIQFTKAASRDKLNTLAKSVDLQNSYLVLAVSVTYVAEF